MSIRVLTSEHVDFHNELERYLLKHDVILANGSKKNGSNPTTNETFLWSLYAATYSSDGVSDGIAQVARGCLPQ